MNRMTAIGAMLLVAALGSVCRAYPIPASSAERAARYAEWRARLDGADRATREGNWEDARASLASVLGEARELQDRSLLLARALDGMGAVSAHAGALADAAGYYDEAAALFSELLGPRQPRVAVTLNNLGSVYRELDRSSEARAAFQRALDIFEQSLGPECDGAVNARRALAQLADSPDQLEPLE